MTGSGRCEARTSIVKFLRDAGEACARYQDETLRGLTCKRIQVDEIWSFVGMKQKNVPAERKGEFGVGDVWTWTAIDADTKLNLSWLLGDRTTATATEFMQDLAARLANRVQITSDGHKAYLEAVEEAFGIDVDYAQLVKLYGEAPRLRRAIAQPNASAASARTSPAIQTRTTSAPAMPSGPT